MPSEFELLNEAAPRAMESVLELRLDDALTNTIDRLTTIDAINRSPWLLCYQAMERRMNTSKQNSTLVRWRFTWIIPSSDSAFCGDTPVAHRAV